MIAHFDIAANKGPRFSFHPGIAVAYVFLFGAILVEKLPILLKFICPWKYFLSVPCPTCGAGRCVRALLELRLPEAFLFNPLFFIAVFIGILFIFHWLVQLFFGYNVQIIMSARSISLTRFLVILLILINYSYLVYFHI